MNWLGKVNGHPIDWLLAGDPANPGVRHLALTRLLSRPADDPEVCAARRETMAGGPVAAIMAAQGPKGHWPEARPGYNPGYRSTEWQITFLAQLGADGADPRVRKGCEYVLDHGRSRYGGFSFDARPTGMIHCHQGNLAAALLDLGFLGDGRLAQALDWLARSITGAGIAPAEERDAPVRYYRSGNSGPGFACAANNHLPCAWGAVKAMLALGKVPENARTDAMRAAIRVGVEFLLSCDPATAGYPTPYGGKPNGSWFRFGYPIGYVTDVLQNLQALCGLGLGGDPRLERALDLVLGKQDAEGRWTMQYTYNGKTWADVEEKGQPSKWVTLRALSVLKQADEANP